MNTILDTFVIVKGNNIISPPLTTTREYGRWFSNVFDEYTVAQELFLKTKKGTESLLESHPGTRIGMYFDKTSFSKSALKCWYIDKDSTIMQRLVKFGLAEINDCSKYKEHQMLRVYTIPQIQLYIRTKIDRNFDIGNMIVEPKQMMLKTDADIIKPALEKRKGLF